MYVGYVPSAPPVRIQGEPDYEELTEVCRLQPPLNSPEKKTKTTDDIWLKFICV